MRLSVRTLSIGALLPLLAACGDDGSGPDAVTRAEIAGRYNICSLAFVPQGAQPTVDLRERAFQLEGAQAPELRMDANGEAQLAYTPRGQNVSQDVRGTFTVSQTRVVVDFTQAGTRNASVLLLPDPLRLNFEASPKALEIDPSPVYNVARADYATLAGIPEAGLAEQIPGTLQADFRTGSCG